MLLFALAMLVQSPAQDGLPTDCTKAATTPEINACAQLALSWEEARMERYLQAAEQRAREIDEPSSSRDGIEPTQQVAYLRTSQTAWSAYADIRCNGVWDQWKDGTIRTVMLIGCQIEATRQRTLDLWTDHLTYEDSTAPILPEPTEPASAPD